MAAKIHIYLVTVTPSAATADNIQRLVRASSKQRALRHVVKDTCHVALASQEELVSLGAAGKYVESAS